MQQPFRRTFRRAPQSPAHIGSYFQFTKLSLFDAGLSIGILAMAAAGLSLAGCALGNFLWPAYFFAQELSISLLDGLGLLIKFPSIALDLMKVTFSANDILYYAIAAFVGYRLAFKSLPMPADTGIG